MLSAILQDDQVKQHALLDLTRRSSAAISNLRNELIDRKLIQCLPRECISYPEKSSKGAGGHGALLSQPHAHVYAYASTLGGTRPAQDSSIPSNFPGLSTEGSSTGSVLGMNAETPPPSSLLDLDTLLYGDEDPEILTTLET